jgi:hypothetical protein
VFSLERCRNILGRDCALDDEQVKRLRDQLYGLADIVIDELRDQPKIKRNDGQERGVYKAALGLLPESEREDVEERAAIIEFEGGVARGEAEQKAILEVVRRRSEKKERK